MSVIELTVPGATLHGERRASRYDERPMLIALHAGVADSRSFGGVFDQMEGMPELIAYDRRGYGCSPLGDAAFDQREDLVRVLDQVAEQAVWLLGNSIGGALALDLAVTEPERLAGLLLLSPAVSDSPETTYDETTERLLDSGERAFAAGDLDEVARLEAKIWLDGPEAAEGRVAGATRALALEMAVTALRSESGRERLERDSGVGAWDRLGELRIPVTVACGLLDVRGVIDQGRAIADRIPDATFVALEDVAHLPSLEAPERVAELARRALQQ